MNAPITPVTLHVARWHPAGARRVLLVHGLGSSSGTWWRVASALAAAGVSVTAPDLRGHGSSPRTSTYRFDEHVADLAALDDRWDLAVGHSLAGPIVCRLARTVHVDRLLLLDPVFDVADDDLPGLVDDQVGELDLAANAAALQAVNPRWHEQDAFQKAVDLRSTSPFTVRHCLIDNAPYHHLGDLAATRVDTVVLGADPTRGTMCTDTTVTSLGGVAVTHRIAHGAGHGIHRDDPEVVVTTALELLDRAFPRA